MKNGNKYDVVLWRKLETRFLDGTGPESHT